jgi:hypothetical protein
VNKQNNQFPDWTDAYDSFHLRHGRKGFTMDFNPALEATMRDPALSVVTRVMAWLKRKSWGHFSDYPVSAIKGTELGQKDCAAELGLKRTVVSNAFGLWRDRGYIQSQGRRWLLNDSPEPNGVQASSSPDFQAFLR